MHTILPAPPHTDWAEDRHDRQAALIRGIGRIDLLLVGDSIAQDWPLELWDPRTAFSLGVGGDLTQHVLWRLDRIPWETIRPTHILIVIGTNHLLFGEPAAVIAAGIEAVASKLEALHPDATTFVLLPPPLGAGLKRALEERCALGHLLASRFGDRLIDATAAMLADGSGPPPNYQDDLVHPTYQGYAILTEAVRLAMR